MASVDNISLEIIKTRQRFNMIRDEWNQLLDNSDSRCICLRWEWMNEWLNAFSNEVSELHVIRICDGDKVIGIAPFYIQIQTKYKVLDYRILRPLGTGEPSDDEVVTEFQDIVALRGYESKVAEVIANYIQTHARWDKILIRDILEDSLVYSHLMRLLKDIGYKVDISGCYVRHIIELPASFEQYLTTLSSHERKEVKRKLKKLNNLSGLEIKRVTNEQELDVALTNLARLHTTRWNKSGEPGAFASQKYTNFITGLSHTLLSMGMLDMQTWTVNGEMICVVCNFIDGDDCYAYTHGYDVENYNEYSLGINCWMATIKNCVSSNLRRFDFMKDVLDCWKLKFSLNPRPMHDITIFSHSIRGSILCCEYRIHPWIGMLIRFVTRCNGSRA